MRCMRTKTRVLAKLVWLTAGWLFFNTSPSFAHELTLEQIVENAAPHVSDPNLIGLELTKDVSIFHPWVYDPAIITVLILSFLYLNRWYRMRKKGIGTPWHKTFFFFLSMATIIIALCSPIAYLSDIVFSYHMLEHLLIVFIAAPFFACSQPFPTLLQGVPRWLQPVVVAVGKNKLYRGFLAVFFNPYVAVAAYVGVMWFWHIPFFYNFTLTDPIIHRIQHISFFVFAFAFWWNILSPYPNRKIQGLLFLPYMLVPMVTEEILSALITFANSSLYAYPDFPIFGLSPLEHQKIGGIMMWIAGMACMVAWMVFLFSRVFRKEQERTALEESLAAKVVQS